MKYKDPKQILEEKSKLSQEVLQINKELSKVQSIVKILPTLDNNCICFTNGIIQYLSREEAQFRFYDEETGVLSDWIKFIPTFKDSAYALEFEGNEVICLPTTEYYKWKENKDSFNITDSQLDGYKKYMPKVYMYSKQAVGYIEETNKKREEENRKKGEQDVKKDNIELSGWYEITPKIDFYKGQLIPMGSWNAIEWVAGSKMYGPDEAMKSIAHWVYMKSELYDEDGFRENRDSYIDIMKNGKFPTEGKDLSVDYSWEGACGMVKQAKIGLPKYIKELQKKNIAIQEQLQEFEKLAALTPEDWKQTQEKDKIQKEAKKKEKEHNDQLKQEYDKYYRIMSIVKWGVVGVVAVILGFLSESVDFSKILCIIITVATWFAMKFLTDFLLKQKRKKLGLPKE